MNLLFNALHVIFLKLLSSSNPIISFCFDGRQLLLFVAKFSAWNISFQIMQLPCLLYIPETNLTNIEKTISHVCNYILYAFNNQKWCILILYWYRCSSLVWNKTHPHWNMQLETLSCCKQDWNCLVLPGNCDDL